MPKRARDGTVIHASSTSVASTAVALKSCCNTTDEAFSAMDVESVHVNVPNGGAKMGASVALGGNSASPAPSNLHANRWKQTDLAGWANTAKPRAQDAVLPFTTPASSFSSSCFFCEATIAAGLPVLLCSGCDHEYCSDCVIQDFTRSECVPYCHSCYSEKQRTRTLANCKY